MEGDQQSDRIASAGNGNQKRRRAQKRREEMLYRFGEGPELREIAGHVEPADQQPRRFCSVATLLSTALAALG